MDEETTTTETTDTETTTDATTEPKPPRLFTVDEVTEIVKHRLAREQRKQAAAPPTAATTTRSKHDAIGAYLDSVKLASERARPVAAPTASAAPTAMDQYFQLLIAEKMEARQAATAAAAPPKNLSTAIDAEIAQLDPKLSPSAKSDEVRRIVGKHLGNVKVTGDNRSSKIGPR